MASQDLFVQAVDAQPVSPAANPAGAEHSPLIVAQQYLASSPVRFGREMYLIAFRTPTETKRKENIADPRLFVGCRRYYFWNPRTTL